MDELLPNSAETDAVFREHFEHAKDELGDFLIVDDTEREKFKKFLHFETIDDGYDVTMRDLVPTMEYNGRIRGMRLRISPATQLAFAESLQPDSDPLDVPKLLTGAGVARAMLAWRVLPSQLKTFSEGKLPDAIDELCSNFTLATAIQGFDETNGTNLLDSIFRIDEDEIQKINTLRLSVGIAVTHLSGAIDWQNRWPETMQERLSAHLNERETYKKQIKRWFKKEDALMLYDDFLSYNILGVSFPMLPDEEVEIFHRLRV